MKIFNIKLLCLFVILVISSCGGIRPPSFISSIPLHVKKGDKLVVASINEYGLQTSFDYALTDHLGLYYTNQSNRIKADDYSNLNDLTYHYFNAIGAGCYKNFDGYFTAEIYGGYGLGFYGYNWTSSQKYPLYNDPSVLVSEKVVNKSYYHQISLKWDIGYRYKYASYGIASSVSLNFDNTRYLYSLEGDEDNIAKFKENNIRPMILPIVLFSNIGLKRYKISIQAGTTTPDFKEAFNPYGSVGLSYSF